MDKLANAAELDEETPCAFGRKTIKKMASVLVKPKVTYVSLVGHAANGMPFGIVKNEDGEVAIAEQSPETKMAKETNPTFGTPGAQLNRLEFDLSIFKTEKDVKQYLDDSTITASRIVKTDTHFVVKGVHENSLENIEKVEGDKAGVTFWIGKLKAKLSGIKAPSPEDAPVTVAIAKAEDTGKRVRGDDGEVEVLLSKSEAEPFDEVITKMDTYLAKQTKTQTLDATLATGGIEIPGMWEILRAAEVTAQNVVSIADAVDVETKIKAIFNRAGIIAAALASVFVVVKKSDEEVAEGEEPAEIKELPEANREALVEAFSSPEVPEVPEKEKEGKEGVVEKSENAKPTTEEEKPEALDADAIAKIVKSALEPVLTKVGEVNTKLEEVQKSANEQVTSLEERILDIEGVRQIRKSIPDDGEQAPTPKSDKDKEEEVRKAERDKREEAEKALDDAFDKRTRNSRLGLV